MQLTGHFDESLQYFDKAEKIANEMGGLEHILGVLYNNLGNAYQLTGDYERALRYFQLAYNYLSQSQGQNHLNTLTALTNLAFLYNRIAQPDSALAILNRLQQSPLTPQLQIRVYRNLANTYKRLGLFDQALLNIDKGIATAERYFGKRHLTYAYSLSEKASIGISMKDYALALRNISEAELAYAQIIPDTDEEYIDILRIKAFIHARLLRFEDADLIYAKIDSLNNVANSASTHTHAGALRYITFTNPNVLIDKARMYQEWHAHTGDVKKLIVSVEWYRQSLSLYEQYSQFATDESRFVLEDDMRDTYEDALRAAWDLYASNGDRQNLDLVFGFAARAKSSIMLSSIRKLQAFEAAGVPSITTETERRLRLEIQALSRAATEERLRPQPNFERVTFLDAKRMALMQSYDSLMQQIESLYPDYYALRYAPATPSITDVQKKLRHDQVLVEYFIESDRLYIFALSTDTVVVMRQSFNENVANGVQQLRKIILDHLANHQLSDYQTFINISSSLYAELIKPLEGLISGRRLIIVPDGVIGYLPFDLLINTEDLNDQHYQTIDYAGLPFLLHNYPLSYIPSSTLTKAFKERNGNKAGSLLAMAPDYAIETNTGNPKYSPLPFALKEAETIQSIWGGVLLAGKKATRKAFIEKAPHFGLLHLAMHTFIDDENPLYSRLIFQPDTSGSNEILSYELYALRFKAAMVVLSACNTGFGALRSAEGVMSLSRAFIYAGVPAVVMTGWEINDQSGERLMEYFYRYLAKGLTKDRALQQAKRRWLNESNRLKAHPFFWASYQMMGDTQPLKKGLSAYLYLILFLIGTSGFLFAVLKRGKRSNFKFVRRT